MCGFAWTCPSCETRTTDVCLAQIGGFWICSTCRAISLVEPALRQPTDDELETLLGMPQVQAAIQAMANQHNDNEHKERHA